MKLAMVDIETTDLKAMMGIVLCCSFKPLGEEPYTLVLERSKKDPYNPNPDKKLVSDIRDEIHKYNCIVTWNGKMFDIPMLNARLMYHRQPPIKPQFHMDMMYYAGSSSNRIGSRKLEYVQQFLDLPDSKTKLDWDVWKRAGMGDQLALDEVVTHCEADVKVLEEAYWRLLPSVANIHR